MVADGRDVPDGEIGELELRNPAVMRGYWDMPEETAQAVSPDGWLRTGDLVHRNPDGTYTFVGREKEVIRRRGENVAPAEIEEALCAHPDVTEAAVIGVPSELTEEEIKAFVAVARPDDADLAAIREAAAALLAPFKVPRYLEAVAELPHTPTGRVAKHELPRERTGRRDRLRRAASGAQDERARLAPHRHRRGRRRLDHGPRPRPGERADGQGHVHGAHVSCSCSGRAPTPQETVLLDAVLVSLAEHGLTPTVLAARLTHTGAPESLQGAVASGLLGAGTVFLGVVEDTAVFLERHRGGRRRRPRPGGGGRRPCPDRGGRPDSRASATPSTRPRTRERPGSTRSRREQGLEGPHLRALRHVADAHREATGKALPINGAGVAGAALADLGFPARIVRGMALLARTAGLVAHLDEEMSRPLGMPLFLDVERRTQDALAQCRTDVSPACL